MMETQFFESLYNFFTVKSSKKKTYSTYDSRVVPHHSTRQAHSCLTSEFGWDPVYPRRYDRMMKTVFFQSLNVSSVMFLRKLWFIGNFIYKFSQSKYTSPHQSSWLGPRTVNPVTRVRISDVAVFLFFYLFFELKKNKN